MRIRRGSNKFDRPSREIGMDERQSVQKSKILMINIGSIPESLGGTEFYTHNVSKSLLQRGYDVTILTALDSMALQRYKVLRTKFEGIEVIKIANSPLHARSFSDHFKDNMIDDLFKEIIQNIKPDLIHFQHVAYLSGNLPEIAHQLHVPSIFTLHDYWYICFRSRLLRPDCGICPGPSEGARCATCDGESLPNPTAVSRSPHLLKFISHPVTRNLVTNTMAKIPQPVISQARNLLFKSPKQNGQAGSNPAPLLTENKHRYAFFKKQFQYPEFVLSPSHHLKQRYEEVGYREIMVLPLGYDQIEKVKTPPFNGQLKIVFIGNIERHKGVLVVLEELLTLQNNDRIKINIHGRAKDPTYFAEIKRFARQYPKTTIEFHGGFRSDQDLKRIFSQNHIMVFPSIWEENAPLVVREALLHGVPVVASNLGGVSEVIDDGVNGLLFDPYKQGDLLEKIQHILIEPDVLKSITQGARESHIESMADHVMKLTDLYNRAMSNHKKVNPDDK